jgi:predicted transcriptional regulator
MSRPKSTQPTDRELAILQVLWEQGPSTVREIHEEFKKKGPTAYTSVLTILQIMVDKGLVTRDESHKSHIYCAEQSQDEMQERIVGNLLDKVFKGSAMNLVTKALSLPRLSAEERRKLKELLEEMEGEE